MYYKESRALQLTVDFVVTQLHLIVFGPISDEDDLTGGAKYNKWLELGCPYIGGLEIQSTRGFAENVGPRRLITVLPLGWPKGSWVKSEVMSYGHPVTEMLSDNKHDLRFLTAHPVSVIVHIPGLFSELKMNWSPLPPYFDGVEEGSPGEKDLFLQMLYSIYNRPVHLK